MEKKRFNPITLLDTLAIVIFVATFTPLVLPHSQTQPALGGIPYSMWMGFLVSVIFVVMAYLVSIANKGSNDAD